MVMDDDFYVAPASSSLEIYRKYKEIVNDCFDGDVGDLNQVKVSVIKEHLRNRFGSPLYRKSDSSDYFKQVSWVGRSKILAGVFCATNSMKGFQGIDKDFLEDLARMSLDTSSLSKIQEVLLEKGILFFVEPNIQGAKIDGMCFLSGLGNPVIVMSLRYSRIDNFWFTLFHELAHVVLHLDKLNEGIVDDLDCVSESLVEKQADKLARDSLIPRSKWRWFKSNTNIRREDISELSRELGIHEAIIAGRFRHDTGRYDLFSDIVNATDVKDILL